MKNRLNRVLTLTLLIITAACSQAQEKKGAIYQKVIPGDASMNVSKITPHKVQYKKGKKASMIYNMYKTQKWGKDLIELNVYFGESMDVVPDRMYFEPKTLGFAGRRLQMDRAGYTIDLKFENNRMTGALEPHEGSKYTHREYDKVHPHAAFEPAVINYAIAALPLKEGYTASIPTMDLNDGSQIIWANVKVEKRETIEVGGKSFDTWKVNSKGVRDKTLWISADVPYVIRMTTKGNPGAWEVVVK